MNGFLGAAAPLVSFALVAAGLAYLFRMAPDRLYQPPPQPSREALATLLLTVLICLLWLGFVELPTNRVNYDLYPTYVAGKLWLSGSPDAIYYSRIFIDSAAPAEWQRETSAQGLPLFANSFNYNPIYLAIMLPIVASMSLTIFNLLFFVFNALASVVVGMESMRLAGVGSLPARSIAALIVGVSFPAVYGAWLGQTSLPTAALLLLCFRFCKGGKLARGTGLLLLAMATKPWAVLMLGVFVLLRFWRAFFAGLTSYLVVLVALPIVFFPTALVEGYRSVVVSLANLSLVTFNNVSLRALLARLSDPEWGGVVSKFAYTAVESDIVRIELTLLLAVAVAFLILAIRRTARMRILFACSCALLILPLGVSWTHYLVFAIPAALVAAFDANVGRLPRSLGAAQLLWLSGPTLVLYWYVIPGRETLLANPRGWAFFYFLPTLFSLLVVFSLMLAPGVDRPEQKPAGD